MGDQVGEIGHVEGEGAVDVFFERREAVGIADDVVFDALGEAAAELASGKRFQNCWIDQHGDGLVESADEIFADGMIDACFAADAGIDHGEKSRRNLNERNAAEDGGGDEADDITNDAATEGEDGGGAFDVGSEERIIEFGCALDVFVFFAGGHLRGDDGEIGFHQ